MGIESFIVRCRQEEALHTGRRIIRHEGGEAQGMWLDKEWASESIMYGEKSIGKGYCKV